jgi:hypothetical protein
MKKMKIGEKVYDVTTAQEYAKNETLYDTSYTALEHEGMALPILSKSEYGTDKPGALPGTFVTFFQRPESVEEYSLSGAIDFGNTKNMRELIEKQNMVRDLEREILVNSDCVTVPRFDDNDSVEMIALKEAIIAKQCDLNSYASRFNGNFANDKRILNDNTITLPKLKKYADALDLKIIMTIEDRNPDVPNPMNKSITVELTGGGDDE